MVDVLSGGRLDLGVGRGSQPREFSGFQARPSESRARLKEGLEIIDRLLSGETVTYSGEYYSCNDAVLYPGPVQRPRPPIWVAGTSLETYTYAGENGYLVMASAGFTGPDVFNEKFGLWEKAIKERGGDTSNLPRSLLHHLHVCEEGEDAEARYEQILEAEGWYLGHRAGVNSVELAEGESEHLKRNWSYKLDMREIIEGGGVIGQAEKVIEDVRRLRDEYGVNNIMVGPWRGPDSKDVVRSLELFAREVMPALQD